MRKRDIIPWLSAGTYGEFAPKLMEAMVLESLLNGSRGITYYWFGDFDAEDFYYHAKALSRLSLYERLLLNGRPVSYQGDNPNLHYTAFASKNEALILVGNYKNDPNGKTELVLPFPVVNSVQVDGKPVSFQNGKISLTVPPGEFKLISVVK